MDTQEYSRARIYLRCAYREAQRGEAVSLGDVSCQAPTSAIQPSNAPSGECSFAPDSLLAANRHKLGAAAGKTVGQNWAWNLAAGGRPAYVNRRGAKPFVWRREESSPPSRRGEMDACSWSWRGGWARVDRVRRICG
jgi:hypothetical protein